MPIVSGYLIDLGLEALADYSPVLTFTLSGSAVNSSGQLVSTMPIEVTPDADGFFTVELATTDDMRPARFVKVNVKWLAAAAGYIGADFLDREIYVPSIGGSISDLIDDVVGGGAAYAYIGESAPAPAVGLWWLVPSTGDLFEWSN